MSLTSLATLTSEFLTLTKLAADKPLVLVVEDDNDILDMLTKMLTSRGYEVLAANNVETALDLANTNPGIHTIITDFYIGPKSANDLLRMLGDKKPKNVVLLSGKNFDGDPKKEVPGIDSHVSKPFNFKKLIEKIDVQHLAPIPG